MARRKQPAISDEGPWRIVVEEMRAQFVVFGDALESGLREVRGEIAEFRDETRLRFAALEAAVRQNSADIKQNTADIKQNSVDIRQNSADIRTLTGRVDGVVERVGALERSRA